MLGTMAVCLKSPDWIRRRLIELSQATVYLGKQWMCIQRMGFCGLLLLASALCGERLDVRRAVPGYPHHYCP